MVKIANVMLSTIFGGAGKAKVLLRLVLLVNANTGSVEPLITALASDHVSAVIRLTADAEDLNILLGGSSLACGERRHDCSD